MFKIHRTVVLFCILLPVQSLTVMALMGNRLPAPLPPLKHLDEIIAQESSAGWQIMQRPDRSGPYRRGDFPMSQGSAAEVVFAIRTTRILHRTASSRNRVSSNWPCPWKPVKDTSP